MTWILVLATFGTFASLAYYAAASVAALSFERDGVVPPQDQKNPPRVVLLKPVYNLNPETLANLETFLQVDYPHLDVVLGVPGAQSDAELLLADLKRRYPERGLFPVAGEEPDCANRKVAKLIRMVRQAPAADIFVLSDADVRVQPDYLKRLVAELGADEKVGVVTCAYRARPNGALASRFEAACVNTDFAPMVFLSALLEPIRHAYGATIAFRRPVLEAIDYFRALKDQLADDFFLGRIAAENGFEIRLGSALVTTASEEQHLAQFWNHQLRWARTYRITRPVSLATIFIHGPFWALVLLLCSHLSVPAAATLLLVIGARVAMARLMTERILKLPEWRSELWLVPIKDLVMTAIWVASLLGNEVLWGGRRFKVLPGGTMHEVGS